MIRLQGLPLQDTEPNLDLVQPGGIGGQPTDPDVQYPAVHLDLFLQPAFELLGHVRRAVVQDQSQRVDAALQRFRDHHPQQESPEINEPFPQTTLAIDLPVRHAQRAKEMKGSLALMSGRDVHRLSWRRRVERPLPLPSLDRDLLVHTNDPQSLLQQLLYALVALQNRTRPLQEGLRVQDVPRCGSATV
jgi:hypothetical protein